MKRKSAMKEEKRQMRRRIGGFTLVELIVVLVILSILAAVAVPAFTGFIDDGKAKECQTQMEALAADIATAKMSYEVGDETGGTFDIGTYIASAGELGKCPSGGEYSVDTTDASQTVIACSLHGKATIPNSGKFSVTVAAPIPEVPSPAPETSTPTPEIPTPTPDTSPTPESHTYTFKIVPDPASSLENMEKGSSADLTVQVYEDDKLVEDSGRITVEWHFPGCVSGTSNGMSATVEAVQAGGSGQITCDVIVADKDDNTKKSSATGSSVDVSVKEQPKPRLNGVPDNLKMDKNETRKDWCDAHVTDENGASYPGNVKFKYESSDPSKLEVDSETGEVHALESGWHSVTVTATDESGNTIMDENGNPVSKTVTVLVPTLFIEVKLEPASLALAENETGKLTATATVREQETSVERSDKQAVLNSWISNDSNIATVNGMTGSSKETATVTGEHGGSTAVVVTATSDGLNSASVSAEIKVTQESSGLLKPDIPNPLLIEQDHVSGTVNNIDNFLKLWVEEGKEGGKWTAKGLNTTNSTGWTFEHQHNYEDNIGEIVKFTYTLGNESESVMLRVIHPMKRFETSDNATIGASEEKDIQWVKLHDPDYTADRVSEYRIKEGADCLDVLSISDDGKSARIKGLKPGKACIELTVYPLRGSDVPKNDSRWNPIKVDFWITVVEDNGGNQNQNENQNQNQGESQGKITGITLNPSSMTLKLGQSKQLEAVLQTGGGDIDMSKVRYVFSNQNNYALDMTSNDNTAVVTGLVAQQQGAIGVNIYYGNDSLYAACQVNVIDIPVNQAVIDGNCFGAMSWAEFQENVKKTGDEKYHLNQHRGTSEEDEIVLCYDEYGIYIAHGNSADFKLKDNPSIEKLSSFKDFLESKDGKGSFVRLDLEHIIEVDYDALLLDTSNDPLPEGTVVKVKMFTGEYEYYVAYSSGNSETTGKKKTRLGAILEPQDATDKSGWWKLNILQ